MKIQQPRLDSNHESTLLALRITDRQKFGLWTDALSGHLFWFLVGCPAVTADTLAFVPLLDEVAEKLVIHSFACCE